MTTRQWLLIRSGQPENTFAMFAQEILKSEGLNGFEVHDLDAHGWPALGPGDLVLLTRCHLRNAEIDALLGAVAEGARLVCLHPSDALVTRLGWERLKTVAYPGRVCMAAGYPDVAAPIQTHVPIVLCAPKEAQGRFTALAQALQPDGKDSGCPAVVQQSVGQGAAAMFFYDLPKAVARIRFGNPDLSSLVTTGLLWSWVHAGDLFEGYIDDELIGLPQADLHGQLLATVLTGISAFPLARLWYYEEPEMRSAVVFTGDDDGSLPEQFDESAASVLAHHGRATYYLMRESALTPAHAAELRRKGHTFAPHVNFWNRPDEAYFSFPECLAEETRLFHERYGEPSVSIQTHCAPWQGYTSWVPMFMRHGYRLLCMYMSIPPHRVNRYMCGSGRPMRFADADGAIHDCWQQPFLSYDDASFKKAMTEHPREYVEEFRRLVLEPSLKIHHSAIGICSHPISFGTYSRPAIEGFFDLAYAEGLRIYNGDEWWSFHDRRQAVQVETALEPDGRVVWRIRNLTGRLPLMIPFRKPGAQSARVEVDGRQASGTVYSRLGAPYLFIPLEGQAGSELQVTLHPAP